MTNPRNNRTTTSQETQLVWLGGLFQQAQRAKFYGKLTIVMEGGYIHRVVKEESLKPPIEKTPPEK